MHDDGRLHTQQYSRRQALGLAAGIAGSAVVAGCGGGGSAGTPVKKKALQLPSLLPAAVKLPGEVDSANPNVPPAFTEYPRTPYKTVTEPPGRGGTITSFQITYSAPPPPLSKNRWWQQLNKNLNVDYKPTLSPDANLPEKTQALIAGGDMPDIFYLNLPKVPAAYTSLLQGAFTDLTPYLAGDAVKDYPNLGRIPSYVWRNSAIQGGIWGVPHAEPLVNSGSPMCRMDWLKKLGISLPKNSDDLFALMVAFAKEDPDGDGRANTWAMATVNSGDCQFILSMYHVPNNWKLNSAGSLTKDIETDEYEAVLEYVNKLWKAGAFHPNSAGNTWEQKQAIWYNGQLGLNGGNIPAGMGDRSFNAMKGVKNIFTDVLPLVPPGKDGGNANFYQTSGTFGIFCIPAKLSKNKDKVKELLRIMNYFAAPFGSAEQTFLAYGIEGWNFSYKNGIPTSSSNATRQAEMAGNYINSPREIELYVPGPPNQSKETQDYLTQTTANSIPDPTINLVSQTQVSKGPALDQMATDYFTGIATGRKPLSAIKEWRQQWSQQGGEQIRKEYEQALHKNGGK